MIRLALLLALFALPAAAETARVRSGEHDGFSRLVVTLESPAGWTFGRVADGYELRLDRGGVSFDLAQVFSRIPKTRIGAVSGVAGQSALSVTASCACHAEPFEFRPGIIVIDLKDGPPAAGSAFEAALAVAAPAPPPPPVAVAPQVDLAPMQDQLLREMGAAAAAGAIELALDPPPQMPPAALPGLTVPQIRILPEPGVSAFAGGGAPRPVISGQNCIADAALALRGWAPQDRGALTIGPARDGLAGEFDDLDPARIEVLIQHYLALGFGAEARQLAAALPKAHPMGAAYRSMSYIVDAEPDPVRAFSGMETCDTAAALWAVLARQALRPSEKINAAAVVRAFSALPAGLRAALNDGLGQRLLEQGDAESARRIRDSVARLGPGGEAAGRMLEARLEPTSGEPAQKLDQIVAERGADEAAALIARIRLAADQAEALPPQLAADVETLIQIGKDSGQMAELRDSLVLARALSGDFRGAFAVLPDSPGSAPTLWALVADMGPESELLDRAILGETAILPDVSAAVARKISGRLLGLGFPVAAKRWLALAMPAPPGTPEDRLLAARIALAEKDARRAMQHLATDTSADALRLKAEAALALEDPALAASLLKGSGQPDQAARALRLARNWPEVQKADDDAWAAVAGAVQPQALPPTVTLEASRRVLEETAGLQAALDRLLAAP